MHSMTCVCLFISKHRKTPVSSAFTSTLLSIEQERTGRMFLMLVGKTPIKLPHWTEVFSTFPAQVNYTVINNATMKVSSRGPNFVQPANQGLESKSSFFINVRVAFRSLAPHRLNLNVKTAQKWVGDGFQTKRVKRCQMASSMRQERRARLCHIKKTWETKRCHWRGILGENTVPSHWSKNPQHISVSTSFKSNRETGTKFWPRTQLWRINNFFSQPLQTSFLWRAK